MSATEARVHFGEVLRSVVEEETPIVVERGGKPQVVVLSMTAYERLKARQTPQPDWWELARRSREQIRKDLAGRPLPSVEDAIREAREIRDQQLLSQLHRRGSSDSPGR
jgi:prevent-host-death family protein